MYILGELIIVTDMNRRNNVGANHSNIYCQNEYDGRDTNRLNEICQQSTSGRLPQYQGQFISYQSKFSIIHCFSKNLSYRLYIGTV